MRRKGTGPRNSVEFNHKNLLPPVLYKVQSCLISNTNLKKSSFLKGHIGLFLIGAPVALLLIPVKTPSGGAAGLGVLLHLLTGLPPGMMIFAITLFCFLSAGFVLGWKVGIKTLYAQFFLSATVDFLHTLLPHFEILTPWMQWGGQALANIVMGLGLWWAMEAGFPPAGTAALSSIFKKLWGWPVIYSMWVIDIGISLGAGFAMDLSTGLRTFFGACVMYSTMTFLKLLRGTKDRYSNSYL